MRTGIWRLCLIVTGILLSNIALAGKTSPSGVVIDSVLTHSFYGGYGGARNSANSVEAIECVDTGGMGLCVATLPNFVSKSCITTNPTHLEVIRSMSDTSWIRVGYNPDGSCSNIVRVISSRYEPKM